MTNPADGNPTTVLAALAVIAVLSFGAVDVWIRGGVGVVAGGVAIFLLLRPRAKTAPPAPLIFLWFMAVAALLWGVVALIPVGSELRSLLQPGYADVVNRVGDLAGWERRPLALHPRGALFAGAYGAHMLLVTAATAVVVTTARRAARVGGVLVAAATLVVVLHAAQRLGGASSVGWISGVGEGRPFFGPFVNPNHGGVLCAMLVPVAVALALERRRYRVVFGLAAVAIACGAVLSGSRGAVAVLGVGVLVFLLLDGRRALASIGLATLAVVGLALTIVGPDGLFTAFSGAVDPGMPAGADLYDDRPQVWRDASGLARFAPLFGVGGDAFSDAYKFVKVSPRFALASQAHSDPFQIAVEHGLPALFLWLGSAVFVFGAGVRGCLTGDRHTRTLLASYVGALSALFSFALFDFPMRIGALVLLAALTIGMILGLSFREHAPAPRWAQRGASLAALLVMVAGLTGLAVAGVARSSAFGAYDISILAGERAAEAGDLAGARAHYETALLQRPLSHQALLRLAQIAHRDGDADRTVEVLQLAAEVYPTYPFTWLALAQREARRGNREAALNAYARLIALNHPTEEPKAWLDEAFAYAGDFEHLVGYLLGERADRYCPAAQWLARQGDVKLGELLYRLGAERSDACAAELGWRLVAWGRPEEALAWVDALPSTCLSERTRGFALLDLNRDQDGVAAFEAAVQRCGASDRDARVGLARARLALGDDRAIPMLERLLQDRPEPSIRHMLFRGYRGAGQSDRAADQVIALAKEGVATNDELEWLTSYSAGGL